MRNFKLEIEYDGTNYCGWQVQTREKSRPSIQETIEKTLRKILQEKIKLIGSGRTDAGVHAQVQIANFKTNSSIGIAKLQRALNGLLPDDIAVTRVEEVPLDFHSRFDVKSKVYRYTILNRNFPSAMLMNRVYFYPYPLDLKLMQKEVRVLLGRHNFKSFQASDNIERDPVKTIKRIKIIKDKDLIYIDIEADGFLYNMVRNIVGTLIAIGRGKSIDMKKLLTLKDRTQAGPTAPACGLCLLKVKY
jgi:tRNA pseudouridine38-40 synthase